MADYMVTSLRYIIPIPDSIDSESASAFFINPLTAIGMVDRVKQLKAKACIVTAAASQIGRMII
jgi:NADPH2:quinone reductase